MKLRTEIKQLIVALLSTSFIYHLCNYHIAFYSLLAVAILIDIAIISMLKDKTKKPSTKKY